MGHLLDGKWTHENVLGERRPDGMYVKRTALYRDWITADGSSGFKAEKGRYHLIHATTCPWAHRTVLFRVLKKLDGIVTLTDTGHEDEYNEGWSFGPEGYLVPGTDHRARWLHELYAIDNPACTTRVSVPTLWDEKTRKVVNNESSEIIRMFNLAFADIAPPTPDYYPEPLRAAIDETNAFVLEGVNNAINGCGYSSSQQAYDESYAKLFATLDTLEERLGRQRYLCGDTQTEADWRLFPNLVRFDPISYIGYKCNKKRIEDYPNLSNYLRDLYQTPGIAAVCDIEGMKRGVFRKAGPIGSNGIIPKGPDVDHTRPHDRDRFARAA
jgi:putative glutathione S-transferase